MLPSKRKAPPMQWYHMKNFLCKLQDNITDHLILICESHAHLLSDIEKNQMRLLIEAFQSRRLKQVQPIHCILNNYSASTNFNLFSFWFDFKRGRTMIRPHNIRMNICCYYPRFIFFRY